MHVGTISSVRFACSKYYIKHGNDGTDASAIQCHGMAKIIPESGFWAVANVTRSSKRAGGALPASAQENALTLQQQDDHVHHWFASG